jgi:hypothetical protein
MSYIETNYGKLKPVYLHGLTVESFFENLCLKETLYTELPKSYKSWKDLYLSNINNNNYFVYNNKIFEFEELIEFDEDDFAYIYIPNADGTITFFQQFYNGACCLTDCIEEAFKSLEL